MRRRLGLIGSAAALVVVALLAASVPAFADGSTTTSSTSTTTPQPPPPPPPTTPAEEAFRTSVQTMLTGLQSLVSTVQANPNTATGLQKVGADPNSMIASAQAQVAGLNSTELDALQGAYSADPSWQQAPSTVQAAINAFSPQVSPGAKTGSVSPFTTAPAIQGTFTSDCSTAGDPVAEYTATEVANEAQSAAQAVLLATPGVVAIFFVDVPTGVKIAEAVIWGVLNAVYLALSQTLAVATDCAATVFGNLQSSLYPTDPANSSTVVPSSSEISVVNLTALAQGTATEIANVQNTVTAVGVQADTLVTAANTLNSTMTNINTRSLEVQTDVQTLQTNVAVLESTEVTVLNKANQEIANLTTLQQLELRMEIEANLSRPSYTTGAVALFQLPGQAADGSTYVPGNGGYLALVKTIAHDAVAKQTAVGHGASSATEDLAAGDSAFSAGQWKTAYQYYSRAYLDVTK